MKSKKSEFHIPKFNTLLLVTFTAMVLATIAYVLFQTYSTKTQDLYVKVKVSQGLWWSNSEKPPLWIAQAIQVGDRETDLFGNPTAEIIEKRYYPADIQLSPNQYDIFLTLKLAVNKDTGQEIYRYRRSIVAVGSPISFDLNSLQLTGTVTSVSQTPFPNHLEPKKLTMYYLYSHYSEVPESFESIKVGESYFDGTESVAKILSKKVIPREIVLNDIYGQAIYNTVTNNETLELEVEVMAEEYDGKLIYGQEQQIVIGASLNLTTDTYDLSQFVISAID